MNLIVNKIEYINNFVRIVFDYEKESDEKIDEQCAFNVGIRNVKNHVDYVFDDIFTIVSKNELVFSLSQSLMDFFASTDIHNVQMFIQFSLDCSSDSSQISCRYFLKNRMLAGEYVFSYNNFLRIYFSKTGLLSVDRKYQSKSPYQKVIILNENNYSIDNNSLIINLPFDVHQINHSEVLISRFTDYYNINTDIIDNCFIRYFTNIRSNSIEVNLKELYFKDIPNNVWFSVQLLITFNDQSKKRLLVSKSSYVNGFANFDLRKKKYKINELLTFENGKLIFTNSNIGLIFSQKSNGFIKCPLCTVELKSLQIMNDVSNVATDCTNELGDYKGIVIEDALGNSVFVNCDSLSDGVMITSFNAETIEKKLAVGNYHIYAYAKEDDYDWLIPIVVKESNENSFVYPFFTDSVGCQFQYKLNSVNELEISTMTSGCLTLDRRLLHKYEDLDIREWRDLPTTSCTLNAHVLVSDGCIVVQPTIFDLFRYVQSVSIIVSTPKFEASKGYVIIDNAEIMTNSFKFTLSEEAVSYISNHGKCVFYVCIKTYFYKYFLQIGGIDRKHKVVNKGFFDRRDYFLKSINYHTENQYEYELQPYFSFDGILSIHNIKRKNRFRSQMSAIIEDISIEDGILIVKGFANILEEGYYSGLCLQYRNKIEEDAVEIKFSDFEFCLKENRLEYMGRICLNSLSLDGSTWDLRLLYNFEGDDFPILLYLKDGSIREKLRDPNNNDQYLYPDGMVVYPYCTYSNTLSLMHREYYEKYDSVSFRCQEAKAIEQYRENKDYFDSQNIILIFEKFGTCSDNSYHFFKYCMDNCCEKRIKAHIYYIISEDSVDYNNVKEYKDHLVEFGSIKHQIYLLAARLLISSDTNLHAYVYRIKDSYIAEEIRRKKYIFLDHGIAALKNGSYIYGKGKQGEPTWYTVASDFQKEIIKKYYGLSSNQLKVTGLARWDALEDKSSGRKKILIAPTWRRSLEDASDEKFLKSVFCSRYFELLSSERFSLLLENNDIECDFYMHLKFINFLNAFKNDVSFGGKNISSRINIYSFGDKPINELYMECSMMITDYSSVAFDTLWQNKPVIFYQFDSDDFDEMWGSMIDMDKDLPGDKVDNIDELLELVEDYVDNDFSMKKCFIPKSNRFFKYKDHNNCKRIWKVVEGIWSSVSYAESTYIKEQVQELKTESEKELEKPVYIHPYLIAASEGRVGLKTILLMIPRWLRFKLIHLRA